MCGQSLRHRRAWVGMSSRLARFENPGPFTLDQETGFPCWRWPVRLRGSRLLASWFGDHLRAYRPDVVLGYNDPRCALLRQAASSGHPALFFVRSMANVFGPGRFIPDGIELIANAPFTASVVAAATGRIPDVVLPAVDLLAHRAPQRERRFITFINPVPEKGVEVASAVARAMPDRRFLFVKGRWADRSYSGVVGGSNVEVWEYQEDMRRVYGVTDVLLMPSQWPETFGRVALEAQANGIPVVAAAVGGIPYVVGRGGVLVQPKGDASAYVAALTRLADDSAAYEECSARALENVQRPEFLPEGQVDAFVAIAERRMAATTPPPATTGALQEASRGERAAPAGACGIAAATLAVSLLQGTLFALARPGTMGKVTGVSMGLMGAAVGARGIRRCSHRHFVMLALILGVQLALFAAWALPLRPLPAPRSMYVGLFFMHGGLILAGALAALRVLRLPDALLLAASLSTCLFVANFAVRYLPTKRVWLGAEWVGGAEPHPVLGYVYKPHTTAMTFYPDNPRGYFEVSDPRESVWNLETYEGSAARLAFPPGDRRAVRVEIEAAAQPMPWHVQLRKAGLTVREGRSYVMSFRGRSDAPRRIAFAVSQAHQPWQILGLYGEADLGPEWRSFRKEFRALQNDERARIHFDLGGRAVSVELTDVTLQEPGGDPIEPPARERYTVSFRFNSLGCRGMDRDIPRPNGVTRVLVLGDSFVLGVGVHERDTVTERLQALLNGRKGGPVYEVMNCGVSGYSTREEKLLYDMGLWRYDSQVVLLGMVCNDNTSWADDVKAGRFWRPGKAEEVFALWGAVQQHRRRAPPPDFSGSVAEVRELAASCQKHGARLGVFFFRNAPLRGEWRSLVDSVSRGLEGTGVPFVDLGPELTRQHSFQQLIVHDIDGHPNEIAHGMAAAALRDFLAREHLLERAPALSAGPAR